MDTSDYALATSATYRRRIPASDTHWKAPKPVVGNWRKRFCDDAGNPLPESYSKIDVTTGEVVERQCRP